MPSQAILKDLKWYHLHFLDHNHYPVLTQKVFGHGASKTGEAPTCQKLSAARQMSRFNIRGLNEDKRLLFCE